MVSRSEKLSHYLGLYVSLVSQLWSYSNASVNQFSAVIQVVDDALCFRTILDELKMRRWNDCDVESSR